MNLLEKYKVILSFSWSFLRRVAVLSPLIEDGDKYTFSHYFEPKEEREYVFEISKGLSFNNEVFDTNRMTILYNAQYFKYSINRNTVVGSAFSSSSVEFIDNSLDPFTID